MYTLCKTMLVASIAFIICTIIILACNSWQKKHDSKNANSNKGFTKTMVKFLLFGIACLSVSGTFLLLRMYWVVKVLPPAIKEK